MISDKPIIKSHLLFSKFFAIVFILSLINYYFSFLIFSFLI